MVETIQKAVMILVPMILSLSVHEYAHARAAYALGDDTASSMGRMTLNPLAHIDPFGTLLLPLLGLLSGSGFFFGWARPVPVSPVRFTHKITMRTGMLLTAAAGPLSNIGLAFLAALSFTVLRSLHVDPGEVVALLLVMLFKINLILAVFNLIPVPPLDGSRILKGLLPRSLLPYFEYLERNPMFVLVAFAVLIFQAGTILAWPVDALQRVILTLTGN